jgi:hypothetical protein
LLPEWFYRGLGHKDGTSDNMKQTRVVFIVTGVAAILTAAPLWAGVRVETAEPKEKLVAFQTADNKYLTATTGGVLDLTGMKIGSRQKFTLIDITGGQFDDGDQVRIRYTPGGHDVSKSNYWFETKDGVKRGRDGDVFKLKRVDTKYAFLTPSGKYLAAGVGTVVLSLSDKLEGALLVELVDPSSAGSKSKAPKPPAAAEPAPQAPEKPATE